MSKEFLQNAVAMNVIGALVERRGNVLDGTLVADGNFFDPQAFPGLADVLPDHRLPVIEDPNVVVVSGAGLAQLNPSGITLPTTPFDWQQRSNNLNTISDIANADMTQKGDSSSGALIVPLGNTSIPMHYIRSEDNGDTWTHASAGDIAGNTTPQSTDFISDNHGGWLALGNFGFWSYSTDEGATWTAGNQGFGFSENNPMRAVAMAEESGLGRVIVQGPPNPSNYPLAFKPRGESNFVPLPARYGLGSSITPNNTVVQMGHSRDLDRWVAIFRDDSAPGNDNTTAVYSDDDGASWTLAQRMQFGFGPQAMKVGHNGTCIAVDNGSGAFSGEIFRSTDGGATWTNIDQPFRDGGIFRGFIARTLATDKAGRWCILDDQFQMWVSNDDGVNWTVATTMTFESTTQFFSIRVLSDRNGGWIAMGYQRDWTADHWRSEGGSGPRILPQWQQV